MNEGGNFLSMGIQAFFSIKDARTRRKRLQEQVDNAKTLEEKVANVATLEHPQSVPEDLLEEPLDDLEEATPDTPTIEVSGFSQITAHGKACIPCGNDHFSTASSMLQESLRFARESGIEDTNVILRISAANDELNGFERIDGSIENMLKLPPDEKKLMNEMLKASRDMRHLLKEIKNVPTLETAADGVQKIKSKFFIRVFKMSMEKNKEA